MEFVVRASTLKKIPHLELTHKDPVIVDHFDVDPEKVDSLKAKISAKQAANPDKDIRHRSGTMWTHTFSNKNGWKMLDHTVYGIRSASNFFCSKGKAGAPRG